MYFSLNVENIEFFLTQIDELMAYSFTIGDISNELVNKSYLMRCRVLMIIFNYFK